MNKIVAWALGVLVLLVLIGFIYYGLGPGTEGSLTNRTLAEIFSIAP